MDLTTTTTAPQPSPAHRLALEKLFHRISNISSLPHIAQRIFSLASNDSTTVDDLREVIQTDPGLAAKVLRHVNSSYFGLKHRVADLRTAISLLGFREIRNVCLTIFVSRMFNTPGSYHGYSREGLWRHCHATAMASQRLARVSGVVPPDEAYAAGLLHHMGTVLIDEHLRQHFCQVLDSIRPNFPVHIVERDILSFDQGQLGEYVALKWNFPRQVAEAIRYYQYPEEYNGEYTHQVHVLALANYFCHRKGCTSLGVPTATPPKDQVFSCLGLKPATVTAVWDELQTSLSEAVAP